MFDIKNACNSVLNAIEAATALITAGMYRTILITCGECSSRVVRWTIPTRRHLTRSLAGFTFSDAGAALILTASTDGPDDPGVLHTAFWADSAQWPLATVGGGSRWPREDSSLDDDERYAQIDGAALFAASRRLAESAIDPLPLTPEYGRLPTEEGWRSFALVGLHQINAFYHRAAIAAFGIPPELTIATVAEHGNLGAATLPLQLVRGRARGLVRPGDLVALIGMGSGLSLGIVVLKL
ncbi:3-oxoacyl-ACP synthase III family protein [Streptomyces sp. NPDC008001]|uniref:3-oxoacyl-ACP synthase III family protein n=1 Tax=Streptomyces sp. NPDC008001 TaxID=3364804 RepID=UPI0036E3398D